MDEPRVKMARPQALAGEAKPWYRINNLASGGAAEIFIYADISDWDGDVNADSFVREVREITADRLNVHINSRGGDVFGAVAIYQALRNHPAEVTTYVDSLAASSASFIAMAGDRRVIGPHGTVMIHDAWGLAMGNAAELRKTADDLDRVSDNIASIYASRSSTKVETWRAAMLAETWYSAKEAVSAGLMDEVQADEKAAKEPAMKNRHDLSIFNFAGRSKAPAPLNAAVIDPAAAVEAPTPAAPEVTPELPAAEPEPVTPEPKEEDPVSDLSEVRSRLGLPDDADDTATLAALDELKTKAETTPEPVTTPDPAVVAEAEAAKAENADLRKEVEKLGDTVQAMSAKLAATEANNAAKVKASVLDEAQKLGKFAKADRKDWEKDYDEAPGVTARLLARIEPGTAVPVNTLGVTGPAESVETVGFDESEYNRLFGVTTEV